MCFDGIVIDNSIALEQDRSLQLLLLEPVDDRVIVLRNISTVLIIEDDGELP